MSMKKKIDTDEPCTYCGDVGLEMMQHGNTHMCRNCATTVFMMFTRIDQLEEIAQEMSAEAMAKQNGEYKDADGVCACPGCTMNELMLNDDILRSLSSKTFRAEEVLKDGAGRHSVH